MTIPYSKLLPNFRASPLFTHRLSPICVPSLLLCLHFFANAMKNIFCLAQNSCTEAFSTE